MTTLSLNVCTGPAQACRICRFWHLDKSTHDEDRAVEDGDIAVGSCRRRAPVVLGELAALGAPRQAWGRAPDRDEELSSTQIYRASPHPVTECNDWCGEFLLVAGARQLREIEA